MRRDDGHATALPMSRPVHWTLLCAALAALALLAWPWPRDLLDWQPDRLARQPWRAISAAFVHWTPVHLGVNLAGCGVIGLLGHRGALGRREAAAGLIALPLTQLGLLLRPDLLHYGGLSGELHALVVIAALALLPRPGRERLVGLALLLGLGAKLALEHPFGPALRSAPGLDFPVAPFAHTSGAMAGLLAGAITMRRFRIRSPHGT